jgi:maltose alpha-D-glucosyltransferase/alpha-amylase
VFAIRYDWRNNSVLILHNLDPKPREITFNPGVGAAGHSLINVLSGDHSSANAAGNHHLLLEGYGYRWYRVGGLDYLLARSEIDTRAGSRRPAA